MIEGKDQKSCSLPRSGRNLVKQRTVVLAMHHETNEWFGNEGSLFALQGTSSSCSVPWDGMNLDWLDNPVIRSLLSKEMA